MVKIIPGRGGLSLSVVSATIPSLGSIEPSTLSKALTVVLPALYTRYEEFDGTQWNTVRVGTRLVAGPFINGRHRIYNSDTANSYDVVLVQIG